MDKIVVLGKGKIDMKIKDGGKKLWEAVNTFEGDLITITDEEIESEVSKLFTGNIPYEYETAQEVGFMKAILYIKQRIQNG